MTVDVFYQELQKLIISKPKPPSIILFSEHCEYGNNLYYSKNAFYCFDSAQLTDCMYIYDSYMVHNSIDCDYTVESELCYESVDAFKCFNCDYLEYCDHMTNASFSYNCSGCTDIFGCVNLTNKSFCIFNRQLTENEYHEKVKFFKTLSPEKILTTVEKLKKLYPKTQTIGGHNENTTYGNYLHYNKNCYLCFDAAHDENCAYVYDTFYSKTTLDGTYSGRNVEVSYQIVSSADIFNCDYTVWSKKCLDSAYLFGCYNVKNSLGCVDLTNKQYCILNRQFSKEEYERISAPIIAELSQKNLGWNNLKY